VIGAEFGSFFHNVTNERGESSATYTLSGAPTFGSEGVVRSDDITKDSRYGMPTGHLPVRSYLAVPVVSRSGEVLGGLFFGRSATGRFTERHQAIVSGIAGQGAIAMDNARLFEQAQWVQADLNRANEELRRANRDLETFAYSASHDLQEPLRNVALSAQLLELNSGDKLDQQQREFLDSILHGARRMETLMRDLLIYIQAIRSADGPPPNSGGEGARRSFGVIEVPDRRVRGQGDGGGSAGAGHARNSSESGFSKPY
jgi:K+-sensing histidine kinase KdpD